MAVARRMQSHEELRRFLASTLGKELLAVHSLRRSRDLPQRANEWGADYPVELHVVGRLGFSKPSGYLALRGAELQVSFSHYSEGRSNAATVRRAALLRFAAALATRYGLRLVQK